MVSIEILALILTGLGLTASIVYYTNVIQSQSKARQRELIFRREQGYSQDYIETLNEVLGMTNWTEPKEFEIKYGRYTNPETNAKFVYIMRVFTFAGIILREKHVDSDLLFQLYPPSVAITLWEQFQPVVYFLRENCNDSTLYEPLEYLYNEAKRRFPNINIANFRDEMLEIRDKENNNR